MLCSQLVPAQPMHAKVREALKQDFPDHDIVEFWGNGPIIRQMQLFATASVIVAPHGAGLSNMVVSPLHTPVLEIGSPDCSACYLHLALKVISERRCGKHFPTFHKLGDLVWSNFPLDVHIAGLNWVVGTCSLLTIFDLKLSQ